MAENIQGRLQKELAEVEAAIAEQERLRGTLQDSVLEITLATLRTRYAVLREQLTNLSGREVIASEEGAGTSTESVTPNRDVNGNLVVVADPDQLWQAILHRTLPAGTRVGRRGNIPQLSAADLRHAIQRYLTHLIDRYRYLEFKGMGVSDQVPLRLPLVELYVPLKARITLPRGETWPRELHLAGRAATVEEIDSIGGLLSRPVPTLSLLRKYNGLIILGDPGAGKTTFLKYMALRLAMGEGETLGLGARLPVLLPLSAYANALMKQDVPLDRFIADYYRDRAVDLPLGPMLDEALARGGTLLLLDGLDEVHDLAQRHLVVQRVIDFFSFHRRAGNKFILTSRIIGYREVRPTAEGLVECTLVDFGEEEIDEFVNHWTGALERAALGYTLVAAQESTREQQELLAAIYRSPGVRRLAANPLLLTILALMKRQGVVLPERRVELYQKAVEALLKYWNLARGLGRPPSHDLDVIETVRILAPLALWMHETSPGVGLVKGEAMRRKLVEIYAMRRALEPEQAAQQLLADVREYTGLLLERGANEYGFIHLTFQEYLAAVAVASQGQREVEVVTNLLSAHIGDDNWFEVSLLTIGYMGIVQQRDEAAGAVVEELIRKAPGEPGQATVLAGNAVLDAWPGGVTLDCKARVLQSLLDALTDDVKVKPLLREAAGRALAELGDPRPEVSTIEGMQFCFIPAGSFYMGTGTDDHLNKHLDYDYWMARYPVTNAQFQSFIQAKGYQEKRYWTEAGWRWREEEEVVGLPAIERSLTLSNHPVVPVTWHEAVAFTRWLTERLHEAGLLHQTWEACLPSEAEWEKSVRGGLQIPAAPIISSLGTGLISAPGSKITAIRNSQPKRLYPWGDELDPNRAAYRKTSIGTTSAVGCFPRGASPYGLEELVGNVWEWLQTMWGTDWWEPAFKYPYDPKDGREKLEADDEMLRMVRGGSYLEDDPKHLSCAYRTRNGPDVRHINHGFRVSVTPRQG